LPTLRVCHGVPKKLQEQRAQQLIGKGDCFLALASDGVGTVESIGDVTLFRHWQYWNLKCSEISRTEARKIRAGGFQHCLLNDPWMPKVMEQIIAIEMWSGKNGQNVRAADALKFRPGCLLQIRTQLAEQYMIRSKPELIAGEFSNIDPFDTDEGTFGVDM